MKVNKHRERRRRWLLKKSFTRRGALTIILAFSLGLTSQFMAQAFWEESDMRYASVVASSEGYRARQLGIAGLQAGIAAIQTVPEEFLYQIGIALEPPDIRISEDCKPNCFLSYRINPEDGRLNVNNLVNRFDDSPNEMYRDIFERLFIQYDIPVGAVDALIDWIDENNVVEGQGAERSYYEGLNPPRAIKNYPMFSVSEMVQVRHLTYDHIFGNRAPEGWAEEQEELRFQTEDERALLSEADWIAANNLTAFMPPGNRTYDKLNVNSIRYHALISLSDAMSREAVLELFRLRRQQGGYITDLGDLENLPPFQVESAAGITLYEELVGSGEDITGLLKTEGEVYRLVGVGSIVPATEDQKPIIRRVHALYDRNSRRIIFYGED